MGMKTKVLILLLLITFTTYGQLPEIIWQRCINTNEYDQHPSICEADNGYLITKEVFNATGVPNYHGFYDILVTKTDTSGIIIWEKCFGGSATDSPVKIINTGIGEYIVFGKTISTDGDIQSGNHGGSDFWVFKINSSGDLLWEKTYGSTGNDIPADIISLPEGEFVFAGNIEANGGDVSTYIGGKDIWVCRCNGEGAVLNEFTLGSLGDETAGGLLFDNDGYIMLTGLQKPYEKNSTYVYSDVYTAKVDIQGNVIWQKTYGGSKDDSGVGILETNEGYLQYSTTYSSDGDVTGHHGQWGSDIWLCMVDKSGNLLSQKCLGGIYDDIPVFITKNYNGYTIIGYTFSNDGDVTGNHGIPEGVYSDIWIVKLTEESDILWQQCIGGSKSEVMHPPFTVLHKSEDNFTICCESNSGISGDINCTGSNNSIWLIEVEPCPGYFPQIPTQPSGPDTVYSANHPESTYFIDPPANAWTFNWKMEPDSAGELTGYGLYSKVLWASDFTGMVSISAQSANYCGVSNWSEPRIITVYNTIGVPEQSKHKIKLNVYPNPASDYMVFEISKTDIIGTISLMNIFGEEIAKKEILAGKAVFDLRRIENGICFYKTEIEGEVLSGKVIIQK